MALLDFTTPHLLRNETEHAQAVISDNDVNRNAEINHFGEFRYDADVLARHDGPVRDPELEQVTVDEQPGCLARGVVKERAESTFGLGRDGAEMQVRNDEKRLAPGRRHRRFRKASKTGR